MRLISPCSVSSAAATSAWVLCMVSRTPRRDMRSTPFGDRALGAARTDDAGGGLVEGAGVLGDEGAGNTSSHSKPLWSVVMGRIMLRATYGVKLMAPVAIGAPAASARPPRSGLASSLDPAPSTELSSPPRSPDVGAADQPGSPNMNDP